MLVLSKSEEKYIRGSFALSATWLTTALPSLSSISFAPLLAFHVSAALKELPPLRSTLLCSL